MRLQEVIWPNKYVLVALGLWPMHPTTTLARRLFSHFRLAVGLSAVISVLVPEVMTVANNWGDIDILGDFGTMIIVHCQLMLKNLYCLVRRRSFRSVYQHLKDFWDTSDYPEERRRCEQLAKMSKQATIAFTVICFINLLSYEAIPLFTWLKNRREINEGLLNRPLIVEIYYPFDAHQTPIYELIFVCQTFAGIFIISSVAGFDCIVMVFIVHASAQFRFITARFCTIGRKIDKHTIVKNDQELRADIGKCVAQHQRTIKVAEELSSLLSPIFFCQIMSSGLTVCLGGYALIEGDGSGAEIVKFIVVFVSLLVQLIICCAPAELLIQESTVIAETIYYDVPWFALSSSLRRDLCFVIMRAQKACHITALYQVMSICRITEVFNAAGSYLALLRSMKK